jgi:hypothetical protein
VNIQQLRRSLKEKWLQYYRDNREWLVKFGIWVESDGVRRPTSGYILATLSVLEPRLTQLMPLVVDLSSSPDRVITALGLNFSPDDALAAAEKIAKKQAEVRLLPSSQTPVMDGVMAEVNATPSGASNHPPETVAAHASGCNQGGETKAMPHTEALQPKTTETKITETNDAIATSDPDAKISHPDQGRSLRPPHPDDHCSGRESDGAVWRSR